MKTAIFLYEMNQLASLGALIKEWGGEDKAPQFVSLDAKIDFALEKLGMPFISGKTLQNRVASTSYLRADELARDMCESKKLSFLQYRDISLLKPLRFSIQIYFIDLLYYVDIVANFVEAYPSARRLVVPSPTTRASKTSSFLAEYGVRVVVDAVRIVAESRGITFEIAGNAPVSVRVSSKLQEVLFSCKRTLFGAGLSILNAAIAMRSRRAVRILASDYWRNIVPTMQKLPEAELILLDRSEALKMGFGAIWRHKVRFVHVEHFLSRRVHKDARQHAQKCYQKWTSVRAGSWNATDMTFRGASLAPLCEQIMTRLMERAVPRVVCAIAGTYAMYKHLSPDVVLLRASVSEQLHFSILPFVAREIGIPALEVQHGGEYLGQGSATRQHAARFIATYGPLVCEEFRTLGYERGRLFAVGSPRFDAYVKNRLEKIPSGKSEISILSNTPSGSTGERYGTYSIEEYFKALGDAIRGIPSARLLVASRSMTVGYTFGEEARSRGLSGVNYESVGTTPLPELFRRADIFVCSYSTVVYEALIYRLPVIIAAFAPVEKMMADFHFSHFEKAGALLIAHSPEELSDMLQKLATSPEARAQMSAAGWEFMQKNFSFDGHASERIAELVRGWSKKRSTLPERR